MIFRRSSIVFFMCLESFNELLFFRFQQFIKYYIDVDLHLLSSGWKEVHFPFLFSKIFFSRYSVVSFLRFTFFFLEKYFKIETNSTSEKPETNYNFLFVLKKKFSSIISIYLMLFSRSSSVVFFKYLHWIKRTYFFLPLIFNFMFFRGLSIVFLIIDDNYCSKLCINSSGNQN